jgi:hypothetical protein
MENRQANEAQEDRSGYILSGLERMYGPQVNDQLRGNK